MFSGAAPAAGSQVHELDRNLLSSLTPFPNHPVDDSSRAFIHQALALLHRRDHGLFRDVVEIGPGSQRRKNALTSRADLTSLLGIVNASALSSFGLAVGANHNSQLAFSLLA